MGSRRCGRGRYLGGLVLALCGAACGSSAGPRSAAPAAARAAAPGLTEVWRNTTLRPIAQPKAVGAVAIGIVSTTERTLLVVGLDPVTGRKLWQQPLTPSWITGGVRVDVAKVGDDKLAYLRPTQSDTRYAELVVADARTGRDLVRSTEAIFNSPVGLCAGGRDVCITAFTSPSGEVGRFRVDIATGEILEEGDPLPQGARVLDHSGVIDLGDRPGNTLGLMRDGKLLWTVPASVAFGPGFSSDNGWGWRLFAGPQVLVGTIYGEATIIGQKYISDRARGAATVGFSASTGEVLWRDPGSTLHCPDGRTPHPVRCRTRGTSTSQIGAGISFEDLDVTVEGFDVLTGKTTWAVPMGATEALAVGVTTQPAIAGPSQLVVQGPAGPVMLDYATGAAKPPPVDATFWCMTGVKYEHVQPIWTAVGEATHTRPGGSLATICDARGYTATALPSAAATFAVGARIGSHAVIATQDGYVGYRAR